LFSFYADYNEIPRRLTSKAGKKEKPLPKSAALALVLEAVFTTGGCWMDEGFFRPARQKTAGILYVFQGFLTQQGGKRPGQTASNGCEYSFLSRGG